MYIVSSRLAKNAWDCPRNVCWEGCFLLWGRKECLCILRQNFGGKTDFPLIPAHPISPSSSCFLQILSRRPKGKSWLNFLIFLPLEQWNVLWPKRRRFGGGGVQKAPSTVRQIKAKLCPVAGCPSATSLELSRGAQVTNAYSEDFLEASKGSVRQTSWWMK